MAPLSDSEKLDSLDPFEALSRFFLGDGFDVELPKHRARRMNFVSEGEKINDKRIEEKIRSGRITDQHKKEFNLMRDLKDGQEIELREAPFERKKSTLSHIKPNMLWPHRIMKPESGIGSALILGNVDFKTGARLKAKRKGNTIRIDGVAEKGFEDIYNFDNKIDKVGKPYKIRSRWEQPFSATLIVEDDKVKDSFFLWGQDE